MSVQLLDKTRKINRLLHYNNSTKVVFNDICDVLTDILGSNVLVVSKKGKVLGVGQCKGVELIEELIVNRVGGYIDAMLNERMLSILSTKENVNLQTLGFSPEAVKGYQAIDIGHVDIEYEWFKMGASHKVPVPNKFVNEAGAGVGVGDIDNKKYLSEIVCRF